MTEARERVGRADDADEDEDEDDTELDTGDVEGAQEGATGSATGDLSPEARRAMKRAVDAVVAAEDPDRPGRPSDEGMATAEYAIATVAAAGFAGLLLVILRSDEVRGMLLGIVRGALSM